MQITDSTIISIDKEALLKRETLLSLLDIQEPEERARLSALLELRAKEIGLQKEFKTVLKAYIQADEELAKEWKRANARKRARIDLDFDGNGRPLASINNFLQVLENDPKFSGLKFNLLTYSPEQEREGKIERWLDSDDAETRRYIEKEYGFHSTQKCDDALRIVFAKNQYHPIRDLIDSLEWDGVERITHFLSKWTKCEDTLYTREVSRLIFAGGIHRLYNPGCKFDDMPVLIGTKQGEGKSTLVRWLALSDDYFAEVNEFEGRQGVEALQGAWICEISELLAMTRAKEQEAVKSFLTRLNDRYRMPYDKRVTDHPRQCLFIGTTNKEMFLSDKTGNRRFYPVKVSQSGYELFDQKEEIQAYIRQCWAEAKAKLNSEEMKPYANRELISVIREQQTAALEDDYRVGIIEDYLDGRSEVCVLEIWQNALKMGDFSKPSKKDSSEIALILQSFDGWKKQPKVKRFANFGVQKWWRRKGENGEDDLLP